MTTRFRFFSFILTTGILLSSCFAAQAQVAKEDIQKINDVFSSPNGISVDLTYNIYKSYTGSALLQTEKASVSKLGNLQLYSISGLYILNNEKYNIVINENDEMIMVNQAAIQNAKKMIPVDLDSGLKGFTSVEFKKISGNLFCYHLKPKGTEYQEVDIYFEPGTFITKKMVLFHRAAMNLENTGNDETKNKEKPRLEIVFNSISTQKLDPYIFSETNYVTVKGNDVHALPKYSHYRLINNLVKAGTRHKK
jgi:hypothetical protein